MRALILAAVSCVAAAQPAFEVASVKVNTQPAQQRHREFGCANGRFAALGQALQVSVYWAYNTGLYWTQWPKAVPNGDTLFNAVFDIEAKAPGPVSEDQCRLQVQALLADRFKLKVHRETRLMEVYALLPGKNPPKLTPVADSDPDVPGVNIVVSGGNFGYKDKGWTMQQLATFLSGPWLAVPAVDKTGLGARYRLSLSFTSARPQVGDTPDVLRAVEQDLGLKLELRKEPMDVLVIDHVELPDAN